jgi:hypothetical protein
MQLGQKNGGGCGLAKLAVAACVAAWCSGARATAAQVGADADTVGGNPADLHVGVACDLDFLISCNSCKWGWRPRPSKLEGVFVLA